MSFFTLLDLADEILEGRHVGAEIFRRETAADIEADDIDLGLLQHLADDLQCIGIGAGDQALRADMEGEADAAAARGGIAQHRRGIVDLGAEFRGEMIEGAIHGGRLQAHDRW